MEKKVLTEQSIIFGNVSMPKGFEISDDELRADILESIVKKEKFKFSKNWDKLNTFIKDHVRVKFNIDLINKNTWGNFYSPDKTTEPIIEVDQVNLKESPDYICLYGVDVEDCIIKIYYDDNRRKGRSWDIPLLKNRFIIFPSTNMYVILNEQKNGLNYIQTITYEY